MLTLGLTCMYLFGFGSGMSLIKRRMVIQTANAAYS